MELLKKIPDIPKATIKMAYNAGYACGKNGANTTNCHFSLFATPEHTRAWEKGKRDYDEGKKND